MLLQEPIQDAIWNCLNHYDYADAIFLAERLRAEIQTDETLFLLATCYYRADKKAQACFILQQYKLSYPKAKYLLARCCYELGKTTEAEMVLTNGEPLKYRTEEEATREWGADTAAFALQLVGECYASTERTSKAASAYEKSLRIAPYAWQSYKRLCDIGRRPEPGHFYPNSATVDVTPFNPPPPAVWHVPAGYLNGNIENVVIRNGNTISSTPVQPTFGLINCNTLSGIRQFTPEDNQFSILRGKHNTGVYGLTPLTSSFGVKPLDSSPVTDVSNNYKSPQSITPGTNINTDHKIISKRQVLCMSARKDVSPLQVAKQTVFNQSGNTTPSQNVRRSSRIGTTYNVKENNKSPTISRLQKMNERSPTRKSKTIRISKTIKADVLDKKMEVDADSADSQPPRFTYEDLLVLLRELSVAYRHLAHYELNKALDCFKALPTNQFNSSLILSYCGKALVELHQYNDAIQYFEEVRRIDPWREDMMEVYSTALWHLHKENDLSALAHFMSRNYRESATTWCVIGNFLSIQKEHDAAIRFFQRAVQVNESFAYAHTLLGHEYVVTEELDKALMSFRHAIRVDRRHYNGWYGMGSVYSKQEKFKLAEIHYKKALNIHPTSTVILCHIGVAQITQQNTDDAMKTFNKALRINPKSPLCKFHKATLLYYTGRYEEALKEIKELENLAPKEALVFYLTGKIHRKLGDNHLALMYFSWATDLDPKGGANSQVRESNDPLINNSQVSDMAGVLSPTTPRANEDNGQDVPEQFDAEQVHGGEQRVNVSILEPIDMDETL